MSDTGVLYAKLSGLLERGESCALVSVVEARGSAPRREGAKMLIDSARQVVGTVGGGCPEAHARQEALEVIAQGEPKVLEINMTASGDDPQAQGLEALICGGEMKLLVEPLRGGEATSVWRRALERMLGQDQASLLLVVVACPEGEGTFKVGDRFSYAPAWGLEGGRELSPQLHEELYNLAQGCWADTQPRQVALESEAGRVVFFVERLEPAPRLYIAGAGHVGRYVALMGQMCGFRVTVNDDRPQFVSRELFPQGIELSCLPFNEFFNCLRPKLDRQAYVVLVTRGHQHDEESLRSLMGLQLGYLGMIGSRRRTAILFRHLREEGADPQWLAQVHAPIGLDIGSETPAEIAISILAQIISIRN